VSELTRWARLLLSGLTRAGVTDVVICPGSRSTPLAWAALHEPGLRCTSLVDERSAAFFALGQARVTGRPALVICTSGTAAANCYPAVIEASASATPLLILSADRPPEHQHCAAPQTIDQVKLFGDHVRGFFDLGLPDPHPDACRALQRKAAQAVLRSRWPVPGAVHLNAAARKPLEPEPVEVTSPPQTTAFPPRLDPAPEAIQSLRDACARAERGVVVCGPPAGSRGVDPEVLAAFLRKTGFVAWCEAASGVRFRVPSDLRPQVFEFFDAALRSRAFRQRARADCILQLGLPPVSAGFEAYLAEHVSVPRHVVAPMDWPDPRNSAATLTLAEPTRVLEALVSALGATDTPPGRWATWLGRANRLVAEAASAHEAFGEAQAITCVVDSLPSHAVLVLGNSLPIREVDAYCPARASDTLVLVQRGTCGIDGILSGAAGAATASGRPTTVVLGDVSFLHDLGGMLAARSLRTPLVVVVLDNDGGRIFEQLPVATASGIDPERWRFWTCPHGLELARAAALYELPGVRVAGVDDLVAALRDAHGRPGATLIEVVVAPDDPADRLGRLFREIEPRLEALGDA
jgi:2-succinyl-5-enolpyruvyl-6-hydroxy-3-cyclohexene-1-carboxylate synthase